MSNIYGNQNWYLCLPRVHSPCRVSDFTFRIKQILTINLPIALLHSGKEFEWTLQNLLILLNLRVAYTQGYLITRCVISCFSSVQELSIRTEFILTLIFLLLLQIVNFSTPYFTPPVVVVTPKHKYYSNASGSGFNAIAAWVEVRYFII